MDSPTLAPLSVQARGKKAPVASANPLTRPDASRAGTVLTADTTPDVPIETATSPADMASPRAAPALSPAPGPMAKCPQRRASPWGSNGVRCADRGEQSVVAECSDQQIAAVVAR